MKILGISTASKQVSIGLIEDKNILAEFTSSRLNSEDLVVLLGRILVEAKIEMKEIEAIGAAQGPGSYTGLRGGLAAAKSIAQVLNIPIVGVSTLEAMAFNLKDIKGTIAAILDAVRGEFNAALFSSDSKNIRRMTDDIVVEEGRITGFLSKIQGDLHVVTNLDSVRRCGLDNIIFADESNCLPFGINVARIASDKINNGKKDDYLTLCPNYSHIPHIREFKSAKTGV